jgi:hypothetical protein
MRGSRGMVLGRALDHASAFLLYKRRRPPIGQYR